MSDFFEPPPPPPEPPREHRQPEWFGPPDNVVGVVVPLDLTLARTADLALVLRSAEVYPQGAVFGTTLLTREPAGDAMGFMPFHPHPGGLTDDVLRIGVQYADGAKATSLRMPPMLRPMNEPPPEPVLTSRGGGGGGYRWDTSFWLWPLPQVDPFEVVVEWPARGIELTRHRIAVAPLAEAAARCERLWPARGDDDGGGGGAWTSVAFADRG